MAEKIYNRINLRLRTQVTQYLEDRDADAALSIGVDMRKINFCFKFIKELYLKSKASSVAKAISNNPSNTAASITIVDSSHYDSKEMKDLKETLRQRDNEIGILVNMLKKEKKKAADMTNGYGF